MKDDIIIQFILLKFVFKGRKSSFPRKPNKNIFRAILLALQDSIQATLPGYELQFGVSIVMNIINVINIYFLGLKPSTT